MATADTSNREVQLDDLSIAIFPTTAVSFIGTSAQLMAEGLIPKNPTWPKGSERASWNTEEFNFSIIRRKPAGMKGPKAAWITLDNWWLIRTPHKLPTWESIAINEKTEEIERIKFLNTREGKLLHKKYWTARNDAAFQSFKALIPGLLPPKRGRKLKEAQEAKTSQD